MPIITDVDHEYSQIHSTAIGLVTYDDVRDHLSLVRHAHGLSHPELIDARGATLVLTEDDVGQIAELLRNESQRTPLRRTAVLVDTDLAFGVLRELEVLVEGVCEVKPFRDEQEARAWLAWQ